MAVHPAVVDSDTTLPENISRVPTCVPKTALYFGRCTQHTVQRWYQPEDKTQRPSGKSEKGSGIICCAESLLHIDFVPETPEKGPHDNIEETLKSNYLANDKLGIELRHRQGNPPTGSGKAGNQECKAHNTNRLVAGWFLGGIHGVCNIILDTPPPGPPV